jgi:hypothetical protein
VDFESWFQENCLDLSDGVFKTKTMVVDPNAVPATTKDYTCLDPPPGDYLTKTNEVVRFLDGESEKIISVDLINSVLYEDEVNEPARTFRFILASTDGTESRRASFNPGVGNNVVDWVDDGVALNTNALSAFVTVVDSKDKNKADQIPPSIPGAPIAVQKTGGSLHIRPQIPHNVGGAHVDVLGHVLYMAVGEFPKIKTTTKPYDYEGSVTPDIVNCNGHPDVSPCAVKVDQIGPDTCETTSGFVHDCWRYVKLICMPQFFGPGCTSTCPGYAKLSESNQMYVCSGHGTCNSGLCDEDEVTCTGGGTCECDNGFEGPDCSEGDLGVPRTIISLNPNDPDRDLNVPAYLVDRFDNPAIDDEIASRRVSRLQASTSQGSNSDVIVAQRYYFYTIARTRISAGGLLPADTPLVPPTETPFVVSFSAPSAVLNVATTTASLPRAP